MSVRNYQIEPDYEYTEFELCIIRTERPDVRDFPVGAKLFFEQESGNEYDANAVVFFNSNGEKGGYLYRGKMQDMANDFISRGGALVGEVAYYNGNKMLANLAFYRNADDAPKRPSTAIYDAPRHKKYTVRRKDGTEQPKKKKLHWFLWFIAVLVFLSILANPSSSDGGDASKADSGAVASVSDAAEEPKDEKKPEYLKKIEWADHSNLVVAVEVDDYDGDVIKAGTWTAEETDISNLGKGKVPIVWDICVVDGDRVDAGRLSLKNEDIVCTVGGWDSEGQQKTFEVKAGQYVAVVYNDTVGKPSGILKLKHKE